MFKGEFGNFCVLVAAWGALGCAVAASNYFGHGQIRLVSEDTEVKAPLGSPLSYEEPYISAYLRTRRNDAPPVLPKPNVASKAVLKQLFLDHPEMHKDLKESPGWPFRGVIFRQARASAFGNFVAGNYTAAGKLFDLAKRHPMEHLMCGDDNGLAQIAKDEALLAATVELQTNPGAKIENKTRALSGLSQRYEREDLAELTRDKGIAFTLLRINLVRSQTDTEHPQSDAEALAIATTKALLGELSPAQRLVADAACDRQMQREPDCTTAFNAMLCGRYWASTGVPNRALEAFEFAQRFHDVNSRCISDLYEFYKNRGLWFKAYDFALEGSRRKGREPATFKTCLLDFYIRLERSPKWRAKLFQQSPALAAELNQNTWRAQAYKIGSEALADNLSDWTTEDMAKYSERGPIDLCAPSLNYLIEWCQIENLQGKLKPLLDINLALAKTYGTTSDIADALSQLRENYGAHGEVALAAKCDAALYQAITDEDGVSDGAGGVLWLTDLSLSQLANCCKDALKKKTVLNVFAAGGKRVTKQFGAGSLQDMMQTRNLAHFLLACGDNDQAAKILAPAWAMALEGKTFPIEERRKVLIDYIAALKATNNESEAAKLTPLLVAITEPEDQ